MPRGTARIWLRTGPDVASLPEAVWSDLGMFPPANEAFPDEPAWGAAAELRIHTLEPGTVVERIDVLWECMSRGQ